MNASTVLASTAIPELSAAVKQLVRQLEILTQTVSILDARLAAVEDKSENNK